MTPYEIGVLLHYYCRAEDHEDIDRQPPVWRPTILAFKAEGLLRDAVPDERNGGNLTFTVTERGKAFCEALQRVPLPIQKWVMP